MHMHMHMHMHMRAHLFQASRSEAVGRRAQRWPVPLPSVRAEARSFRRKKGRACLSAASLRGPRLKRAPQVARSEAKGRAQWGRLFFGYFLLAKQKKVTRLPGRHPGSSLKPSATPKQANGALTPALSQREREQERE